jgi:hypothetical protein
VALAVLAGAVDADALSEQTLRAHEALVFRPGNRSRTTCVDP